MIADHVVKGWAASSCAVMFCVAVLWVATVEAWLAAVAVVAAVAAPAPAPARGPPRRGTARARRGWRAGGKRAKLRKGVPFLGTPSPGWAACPGRRVSLGWRCLPGTHAELMRVRPLGVWRGLRSVAGGDEPGGRAGTEARSLEGGHALPDGDRTYNAAPRRGPSRLPPSMTLVTVGDVRNTQASDLGVRPGVAMYGRQPSPGRPPRPGPSVGAGTARVRGRGASRKLLSCPFP